MRDKTLISSALSGFCAQPSRPTTLFCATKSTYGVVNFSDKRGSKRPKKPQNRSFLLGIAVQSGLRGGSMSPRLFLQQNTAKPKFYPLSSNCRILRSLAWLAHLVAFVLQSAHRAFLWLTRGYLRQKRRRIEWSLAALISLLNCDYHLATAPINSFVFVGVLDFTTPNL